MKVIKLERESTERLVAELTLTKDPALWGVEWSFPARGERPAVWEAGTWADPAIVDGDRWIRKAVSPQMGTLPPGWYNVFVRLTGDGDAPVLEAGKLEVQ